MRRPVPASLAIPTFLLRPDIFAGQQINVSVETGQNLATGMTVADWWGITDRPRNVFYVNDGNPDEYYNLLIQCLSNLP
jgi:purine nucleosidase